MIRIYAPGRKDATFARSIRIVSHAVAPPGEDGELPWLANDGLRLIEESERLLADIAIRDSESAPEATPLHKTIRYPEGGIERMERGELVSEECDRKLIRTLRGGLLSVPVTPGKASAPCAIATTVVAHDAPVPTPISGSPAAP